MRHYFTKRHSGTLREKKLKPSIPYRLRVSIRRVLLDHSEYAGPRDISENISFTQTEETLRTFYGEEKLQAFNNDGKLAPTTSLFDVINCGLPANVFDAIEAWCDNVSEATANKCERELNSVFEIHDSPWRIVNRTIILVDSQYIQEEIIANTQYLLRENSISGALEEFNEAVSCLTGGQTKEAIINAHKSIESVMKAVLGVERARFGILLSKLIKSGLIPEYYEDFLVHFEKFLLGASKERNLPARGHGQGAEPTAVQRSLAEFAVHLAGVINLFIIRRWIEANPKPKEPPEDEGIPF